MEILTQIQHLNEMWALVGQCLNKADRKDIFEGIEHLNVVWVFNEVKLIEPGSWRVTAERYKVQYAV